MKNGRLISAQEFLEEQKEMRSKRTLRGIALSIENQLEQGHKHLKDAADNTGRMANSMDKYLGRISGAALVFVIGLFALLVIKELKGTNFLVEVANWFKVSSTVVQGKE